MERARQVLKNHIAAKTTPGATAVVISRDRIVATLADGRHTYDVESSSVQLTDRYDLASLTKVVTTTACLLLEEDGKLALDAPVSESVPDFSHGEVTVRHLLAHCSGMPAHRPLYETCRSPEAMLDAICQMPLEAPPGTTTLYSDIGFMLLGAVLERCAGLSLDDLLTRRVLLHLGMSRTGFRPARELLQEIPPTERTLTGPFLRGVVHDENARAMQGVAPHAGLFGTATDMGRLLQAYLNDGWLDGRAVLPAQAVRRYVRRAGLVENSTRALGWDTVSEEGSTAGRFFSTRSFGHLGFTGTSLWADPDRGIGVVLLTNRVHPTRENEGIRRLRPEFHDAVAGEAIRNKQ